MQPSRLHTGRSRTPTGDKVAAVRAQNGLDDRAVASGNDASCSRPNTGISREGPTFTSASQAEAWLPGYQPTREYAPAPSAPRQLHPLVGRPRLAQLRVVAAVAQPEPPTDRCLKPWLREAVVPQPVLHERAGQRHGRHSDNGGAPTHCYSFRSAFSVTVCGRSAWPFSRPLTIAPGLPLALFAARAPATRRATQGATLPSPLVRPTPGSAAKRDSNYGPRSGPTFALRQPHPVVVRPASLPHRCRHRSG